MRQHIDGWTESIAAVVGGGDVDMTDGEIVIADVDLVLVRGNLAREDGDPGPVDERRIDRGDVVDCPSVAAFVAEGQKV